MNKMSRVELSGMYETVNQVGDKWSLLILWAALHGISRFDNFQIELGVARNILSDRLAKLVEAGLLAKRPIRPMARRMEYRPTPKGEALRPALKLFEEWGRGRHSLPSDDGTREVLNYQS